MVYVLRPVPGWTSLDGEPVERQDRRMSSADDTSHERRLLLVSVGASTAFAVGSSVWGLLSGSAMIVFDGLSSFVSIGLSLLAVVALRVSQRGPSPEYPWGTEMWEPL